MAFPVSAVSGSSTVTINPIVDSENNQYYPAAGVNYSGYFYSDGLYVDSPLSLTKGWIEPASSVKKSSASKAGEVSKAKVISASENVSSHVAALDIAFHWLYRFANIQNVLTRSKEYSRYFN